jgi:hypothetical protein
VTRSREASLSPGINSGVAREVAERASAEGGMPGIRYVALSDLHLGHDESLLTHVDGDTGSVIPDVPSPTLRALAACLRELAGQSTGPLKPTLILNGDILELALCEPDHAIKTFAQFIALLTREGESVFDEIVYVPGNHDHHLWEMARETQYLNYMRRLARIEELEPAWHTTKLFMGRKGKDRLAQATLTTVARKVVGREDLEVLTAYPNFGILDRDGGQGRSVLFHHGHFIEAIYHAMSTAASLVFSDHRFPSDVYALEAENFAWIDFFWSTMGRSGQAGTDVERIYEATGDAASLRKLTDSLARNLAWRFHLFTSRDSLEEAALRWLFRQVVGRVAGRQERQRGAASRPLPLSEDAEKGLRWYLEGPLRNQVRAEHRPSPNEVTFVFGHTHRPFECVMDSGLATEPVRILNTGGWVVDTRTPRPEQGGAVALIGEDLSAVSLRLYNEGRYAVHVEEPLRPGETHSALWEQVHAAVQPDREPWLTFTDTVAREAQVRMERVGH